MSRVVKQSPVCLAAALVAVLDGVLCMYIVEFFGYSQHARSGSGRMWVETKIGLIALAAIPIVLWLVRSYFAARREMSPPARFLARLPLICLVAFIVTYFLVL